MIDWKPEGSVIQCKPDKFANFLSSLVFLVSVDLIITKKKIN